MDLLQRTNPISTFSDLRKVKFQTGLSTQEIDSGRNSQVRGTPGAGSRAGSQQVKSHRQVGNEHHFEAIVRAGGGAGECRVRIPSRYC